MKWKRECGSYRVDCGDVHTTIHRDERVGWKWTAWGDRTPDFTYLAIDSSNRLLIGAKLEAEFWARQIINQRDR